MQLPNRRLCVGLLYALALAPVSALALDYRIERIASGLNQPTYVTQAPGDPSNTLYFTERTSNTVGGFNAVNPMGKIYRYDANTRIKTAVLDLASRSVTQDDGLTAIAFSPDFNTPGTPGFGKMYVSSAASGAASPTNRIEEYTIGASGLATFSRTILQYNNTGTAFQNHTIDWLGFDPTATGTARNYLYISSGDGNFSLPNRPSQSPNDPQGKILRVDVAGADAYPADANKNFAIPPSNPVQAYNLAHPASPLGLGEVYVTGLRNPSRASFDRANGDMYIGDVGESTQEELDFLKAGTNTIAGAPVDYGWPEYEGAQPSTGNVSSDNPRKTINPFTFVSSLKPIQQYAHTGGSARAIIGGYAYRGPIASLQGQYFYVDYVTGKISETAFDRTTDPNTFAGNNGAVNDLTAIWNATNPANAIISDPSDPNYTFANVGANWGISHVTSFGEDNAGNLYIVDFGGFAGDSNFAGQYPGAGQGEIFRLIPVPEPACAGLIAMAIVLAGRKVRPRFTSVSN